MTTFQRKLTALQYINAPTFNVEDEKQVKALVLWLEEQKIRHYKIEERDGLRDFGPNWNHDYEKYLTDLECPIRGNRSDELQWLIGYAVKLIYRDNQKEFGQFLSSQKFKSAVPEMVSKNPLDKLDFQSEDFKAGIKSLAEMMKITPHPDHLITLQAVSKLICERLNEAALKDPQFTLPKGQAFPILDLDKMDFKDATLNKAAKILRLLHIQNLRNLQTSINECIVSVQKVTANPKTDTALGKVGF